MFQKIVTGILVVLFVVIAGAFIFIKTVDLNKYIPQITEQLNRSTGRDVKISKVGLRFSFLEGVAANIDGVSLSDNVAFSQQPFLTIDRISCGVRFMPLLTKRKIEVSYIRIHAPSVTLIKNKSGVFNFESMIKSADPQATSTAQGPTEGSSSNSAVSLPLLLVNTFHVDQAKVNYVDQSAVPAMEFAIQNIDFEVSDFSLTDSFKIKAQASVLSDTPDINFDALARLDLKLQQIRLDDVHFGVDLSKIVIKKVNQAVPSVAPLGLQEGLQGNLQAVANQMVLGSAGILVLSLEMNFTDGKVPLKILANPIDKITLNMDATESKIRIKKFAFNISTGEVVGQGNVDDYLSLQQYDFNFDIKNMPLEGLVDQKNYPAQIKGDLSGGIKINGQGFTPEAVDTLTGAGDFSLLNGELINVNIVKMVLEKITILPGLADVFENQLPEDLKQKFDGKSTKIDKADVKVRFEKSNVIIDTAEVQAQGFGVSAQGNAYFDQTINIAAELVLLKELSLALVDSSKEFSALLDENQEIHIPLQISGKVPAISVVPDVSGLGKKVLINEGGKQLEKVLDKNPEVKQLLNSIFGN